MSIYQISIGDITLEHCQSLIDNDIYESKFIEYKRDLNLTSKEAKAEFLNDISAMANAEGGDIIFGIEEKEGTPFSIVGIQIENVDAKIQEIENVIRDAISPRLNYELNCIPFIDNFHVLIIRIPKSTSQPHMVNFNRKQTFFKRNSGGKHQMDIHEIRESFLTSAGYSKEAYLFHLKDELEYNKLVLNNLASYLQKSPPIDMAFEPLNIGSQHLRLEAWDALVRSGILPLISIKHQKIFQIADKGIREAARIIQMQNAEWKRILQFYNFERVLQAAPVDQICSQKERDLRDTINASVLYVNLALEVLQDVQ